MLKVTIILAIILAFMSVTLKFLLLGMSAEEKLRMKLIEEPPVRVTVLACLIIVMFIATCICGIITIATW